MARSPLRAKSDATSENPGISYVDLGVFDPGRKAILKAVTILETIPRYIRDDFCWLLVQRGPGRPQPYIRRYISPLQLHNNLDS